MATETMTSVERDSAEWARMWAALAAIFGDAACLDADSGEAWQYMGTVDGEHEFRHRALPVPALDRATGCRFTAPRRAYLRIDAETIGKPVCLPRLVLGAGQVA